MAESALSLYFYTSVLTNESNATQKTPLRKLNSCCGSQKRKLPSTDINKSEGGLVLKMVQSDLDLLPLKALAIKRWMQYKRRGAV